MAHANSTMVNFRWYDESVVAKAKAFAVWALGNDGSASGTTPKSLGRGRATAYFTAVANAVVSMKMIAKTSASLRRPAT